MLDFQKYLWRDLYKLDAKKTVFNHYMMIKQVYDQKPPFYFLHTIVT